MINAGFGDTLSPEEILAGYEGWLHHRAHQMIQGTRLRPDAQDHDDLVQHGFIAMWRALETFNRDKGALPAWLTMKATGAMKDQLRAAPTRRGAEMSLEPLVVEDDLLAELIEYPDLLKGVMDAYHAGEVARALDTLTPKQREYVHLRFWRGFGTKALTEHFGYDPSALWNSSKNGAKHKLRAALSHLELVDA